MGVGEGGNCTLYFSHRHFVLFFFVGVSSNEVLLSNADTLHDTNENEDGFFSTVKTMKTVEPSSPSIQDGGSSLEIIHGEPLTDRKSTFQAHIAHVNSVDEVREIAL